MATTSPPQPSELTLSGASTLLTPDQSCGGLGCVKLLIICTVITLTSIWYFVGVDNVSNFVYHYLYKLKSKRLIPSPLWDFANSVASTQGVTISSILNNIVLHFILVASYEFGRPLSKLLYGNHQKTGELHGIWLYKLEVAFHIFIERDLQNLFGFDYALQLFFHTIYSDGHYYVSLIVYYLSLFFASRKTNIYQFYMYMTWSSSLTACLVYAVFPCAPPRLIPEAQISDTFKDIVKHAICDAEHDHAGWANCYAAMPSVHSIWCTISCSMAAYHLYFVYFKTPQILTRDERNVGVCPSFVCHLVEFFAFYWIMMHLVIMASGHHWITDIFGSFLIMGGYFSIYRRKFFSKSASQQIEYIPVALEPVDGDLELDEL